MVALNCLRPLLQFNATFPPILRGKRYIHSIGRLQNCSFTSRLDKQRSIHPIALGKLFFSPSRLLSGLAFFALSYFPLKQGFPKRRVEEGPSCISCPNPVEQSIYDNISTKNYGICVPPSRLLCGHRIWSPPWLERIKRGSETPELQLWQFFTAPPSEKVGPPFLS